MLYNKNNQQKHLLFVFSTHKPKTKTKITFEFSVFIIGIVEIGVCCSRKCFTLNFGERFQIAFIEMNQWLQLLID
jgi:hypothetical protein